MPTPERPPLEIRDLAPADLDTAAALYIRVFNAPPWNDAWTEETATARLAQALATPASAGFAVWADGRMLAAMIGHEESWFDGGHFYLKEMFVDPERQGAGLGSMLMDQLKAHVTAQGMSRIYLLTAREGLAAAFYHRHGFHDSPRMALMAHRLPADPEQGR